MPKVVSVITCDDISRHAPYTLVGVRRKWTKPPKRIAVYADVLNPSRESYDIAFELWRRNELAHYSETELVLKGKTRLEHVQLWDILDVGPKSYKLVVLLNGEPAVTVPLDFGAPSEEP